MLDTPPIAYRANRHLQRKMQDGVILSLTTVAHPPAGFGKKPRTIGLIRLDDGTHILGQLILEDPGTPVAALIGHRVHPRLRLHRVSEQGLRIYDIAYDVLAETEEPVRTSFSGYILALTGPSGVGKTTVSKTLATVASTCAEKVPILTTRKPKHGDDGEYVYVSEERFDELREEGDIIAATRITSSTESRRYGYRASDIEEIWRKRKIPVVVTEMHLLQDLARHYGRRSILSCGLLPPGRSKRTMLSCLLHRLRARGRDSEGSIAERMRNAETDLAFLKERRELFDHVIVNDDVESVVRALEGHVMGMQ